MMDHMCARCARQVLNSSRGPGRARSVPVSRSFSSSIIIREDDPARKPSKADSDSSSKPSAHSGGDRFRASIAQALKNSSTRDAPPVGQILRRTRPSFNTNQRTTPSSGSGAPGQIIRRTSSPRSAGGRSSDAQKPGTQNPAQRGRRRQGPTRATAKYDDAEDGAGAEERNQEYIKKAVDRPRNPTKSIPYNPQAMTIDELRADWPDTPLSATGLIESVQQRIEHLARRIPHGYKTPEQLADRLHDGHLVRFESPDEKEKVLEIATNLAKKRADELTERKGEEVKPADMAFDDLNSRRNERDGLVDTIVKGTYVEIEKQRTPLLNNVVHGLRNNATYGSMPIGKFMEKIQALMPPPSASKGAAQRSQKRT